MSGPPAPPPDGVAPVPLPPPLRRSGLEALEDNVWGRLEGWSAAAADGCHGCVCADASVPARAWRAWRRALWHALGDAADRDDGGQAASWAAHHRDDSERDLRRPLLESSGGEAGVESAGPSTTGSRASADDDALAAASRVSSTQAASSSGRERETASRGGEAEPGARGAQLGPIPDGPGRPDDAGEDASRGLLASNGPRNGCVGASEPPSIRRSGGGGEGGAGERFSEDSGAAKASERTEADGPSAGLADQAKEALVDGGERAPQGALVDGEVGALFEAASESSRAGARPATVAFAAARDAREAVSAGGAAEGAARGAIEELGHAPSARTARCAGAPSGSDLGSSNSATSAAAADATTTATSGDAAEGAGEGTIAAPSSAAAVDAATLSRFAVSPNRDESTAVPGAVPRSSAISPSRDENEAAPCAAPPPPAASASPPPSAPSAPAVQARRSSIVREPSRLGHYAHPDGEGGLEGALSRRPAASLGCGQSVIPGARGDLTRDYALGRILGAGAHGSVRRAVRLSDGRPVAVKTVRKSGLAGPAGAAALRREVGVLRALGDHPCVANLLDVREDAEAVHLVLRLAEGGDALHRLAADARAGRPASERRVARVFRAMCAAVARCHALGYVHRDVKLENFLAAERGPGGGTLAADFGLAARYRPGRPLRAVVGTALYVAPEVLRGSYGPPADAWSLGVCLHVMLSGCPPFWGASEEEVFERVHAGRLHLQDREWRGVSRAARGLVAELLRRDPAQRPPPRKLLDHPWVRGDLAHAWPLSKGTFERLAELSALSRVRQVAIAVAEDNISREVSEEVRSLFPGLGQCKRGVPPEAAARALRALGHDVDAETVRRILRAARLGVRLDDGAASDGGEAEQKQRALLQRRIAAAAGGGGAERGGAAGGAGGLPGARHPAAAPSKLASGARVADASPASPRTAPSLRAARRALAAGGDSGAAGASELSGAGPAAASGSGASSSPQRHARVGVRELIAAGRRALERARRAMAWDRDEEDADEKAAEAGGLAGGVGALGGGPDTWEPIQAEDDDLPAAAVLVQGVREGEKAAERAIERAAPARSAAVRSSAASSSDPGSSSSSSSSWAVVGTHSSGGSGRAEHAVGRSSPLEGSDAAPRPAGVAEAASSDGTPHFVGVDASPVDSLARSAEGGASPASPSPPRVSPCASPELLPWSDFAAAVLEWSPAGRALFVRALFRKLDERRAGALTPQDLARALERYGVGRVDVELAFGAADADGDGLVSADDWTAFMAANAGGLQEVARNILQADAHTSSEHETDKNERAAAGDGRGQAEGRRASKGEAKKRRARPTVGEDAKGDET